MKYYLVFCINKQILFFLCIYKKQNIIEYFGGGGRGVGCGYNIKMLEITLDNCYKCDLESQYLWINRRDFEIETKRNW